MILPGYAGANNDNTAVASFLAAQNTLDASPISRVTNNVGGLPTGFGFINGPMPTAPGTPVLPPAALFASTAAPTGREVGLLSQTDLDTTVEASILRWEAAGASEAQLAAMRATAVGVADMSGTYLGLSSAGSIRIDADGGGYGWFVDTSPDDDSEFARVANGLSALDGGAAEGHMDLLTALMHELGHQAGLNDSYDPAHADELMYGFLDAGERHIPDLDGLLASASDGFAVVQGWKDSSALEDVRGGGWAAPLAADYDFGGDPGLDALLAHFPAVGEGRFGAREAGFEASAYRPAVMAAHFELDTAVHRDHPFAALDDRVL